MAGTPDVVSAGALPANNVLIATARLLGSRIRTRQLAEDPAFAAAAVSCGLAFVFRYGVVVTFGTEARHNEPLDAVVQHYVLEAAQPPETEIARALIMPGGEDRISPDGDIVLADSSRERLLLVATVLARSVVLARDETLISEVFERTAPVVADLRQNGRARLPIKQVMKYVGNVLAARHRVMGTVQVSERPDLLWDRPDLDRLYARIEGEYELSERAEILDRKFAALGDFTGALLNIVQDKRAFRLEAAIIALIAFEIVLNLFELAAY